MVSLPVQIDPEEVNELRIRQNHRMDKVPTLKEQQGGLQSTLLQRLPA